MTLSDLDWLSKIFSDMKYRAAMQQLSFLLLQRFTPTLRTIRTVTVQLVSASDFLISLLRALLNWTPRERDPRERSRFWDRSEVSQLLVTWHRGRRCVVDVVPIYCWKSIFDSRLYVVKYYIYNSKDGNCLVVGSSYFWSRESAPSVQFRSALTRSSNRSDPAGALTNWTRRWLSHDTEVCFTFLEVLDVGTGPNCRRRTKEKWRPKAEPET